MKVAIVGGDLRFVRLAQILVKKGFDVAVYGLCHPDIPDEVTVCSEIFELRHYPFIIGPIPLSKDGKSIFTPMCNTYISIEQFCLAASHSFVLGSVLKPALRKKLDEHHIKYVDIMTMDEIAILNAIPTAEGAIQYAMQNSEITLQGSRCLVLGFGRCGKILAQKLYAMQADVSVEARSTKDLAFIQAYGYKAIDLKDLKSHIGNFDFIFNTIPVKILDRNYIDLFNPEVVYIELASVPGGIDIDYCHEQGITHVPAPSLPGIVAPKTAADILYQCLLIILRNQGAIQ